MTHTHTLTLNHFSAITQTPPHFQMHIPESPVEEKLRSTGQAYQFMLWDTVHQFANGLHYAKEFLLFLCI